MKPGHLDAIVELYLRDCQPRLAAQLRSFSDEPSLDAAISRASLAKSPEGKRYAHQRRIRPAALQEAAERLARIQPAGIASFQELHALVNRGVGSVNGIGELYVYDTALRIGARLGLMPEHVYLHCGTRAGVRNLGLPWKQTRLAMQDLPQAFQRLQPYEAEDCLCIFSSRFRGLQPDVSERRVRSC